MRGVFRTCLLAVLPALSLAAPPTLAKRAKTTTSSTSAALDASCTNSATSRNCWSNGYSIATDFDQKHPTTGVTRTYDLTITNTTCNPDGNPTKSQCFLINNQYPGPVITANWGDNIQVTVHNQLQGNGTALHWHGLRQLATNEQDGVPGITECPLAPGQSRSYSFQATQFGTSWYHSHYSAQYGSGLVGAIVINGPASANYDIDLGPLTLTDWYYRTAFQIDDLTGQSLQSVAAGPEPDTFLINGTNMAGTKGKYMKATLTKGKKHLLRLINTSVDQPIRASLDGHSMTLISSDFVPIKPITVDSVFLAIGQRYDVIINADQTAANYWFRVVNEGACGQDAPVNNAGLAIFSYKGVKVANPTSTSSVTANDCLEPSPLTPWVANTVGDSAHFISQAASLDVSVVVPGLNSQTATIVSWGINATAMNVDWNNPTLSYAANGTAIADYPATENIISLPTQGTWVYWIIQNLALGPPIPHPIHLHGHDFYVLGQKSNAAFDMKTDPQTLQYNNPTRRDTALLPPVGWLALAFPTDNPGAWLMHCHIAWHISEGLGVQFLESASSMPQPSSAYGQQCQAWTEYDGTSFWKKEGSGL